MYSFTCWSVAGRPGTSDLLLEARVRSCTHTPRPKGRIKPARRFGRTTAGLRPPCVRPKRPTYVSLTGQGCCRARTLGEQLRHRPAIAPAKPAAAISVSVDSTFIRSCEKG